MAAIKALQQWCRVQCDGYRDVAITNMTTSFRDGLAFCALIHKHRPDLINFDSLKKENVYDNNKLAFKVAEDELGIPALLDAEDMVALRVPDRLSILTYVSQYYNYFHGRSPIGGLGGIKRPAEAPTGEPAGKKNQAVSSKVFPSSKPARENSPPPSSNITRPAPSPKQTRHAKQDVPVEKPHKTGTLSNKCVSCNKHVHLVQRHLVEGKLYHRHCAKALSPINTLTAFRDLPTNTAVSKFSPLPDSSKNSTPAPLKDLPTNTAVSKFSPLPESTKNSTTAPLRNAPTNTTVSKFSPLPESTKNSTTAPLRNVSAYTTVSKFTPPDSTKTNTSSPLKDLPANTAVSKSSPQPESTKTNTHTPSRLSWLSEKPSTPPSFSSTFSTSSSSKTSSSVSPAAKESQTSVVISKPTPTRTTSESTSTTTTSINTRPTPAPRTSTTATKTLQSKFKFFQSDNTTNEEEKKTTTATIDIKKAPNVSGKVQEATVNQAVTVVVTVGGTGKKEANVSLNTGGEKASAGAGGNSGNVSESSKTKASAAAFISKKLTEENNNNSKPAWTTVALKKTDKPSQVETPNKETEKVRGRVRLRADPSILADLQTPDPPNSAPTPANRSGLRARTPDRGSSVSPNRSASENQSPADWRSKLKPISKDIKAADPSQSSPKPWANGAGKTSEPSVRPSPSPNVPTPSISVTPPAPKGFLNGQRDQSESKIVKTKPDYIQKEDIIKELQFIEDNLNELEKRGVELEVKLRSSEEEGEDDSLMDELMVEWFNLIRNKQVAMRRESELVYIGRTQDLEEQQPSVEQELRRLMEKPEDLKTHVDRKREAELMAKLMEIVNDRNAIVDGLDEDRIREEEEDEELDKMMRNFSFKKDKPKKKSPMSKLFGWGNKKEG
uniref:protein-methionine sulfoxide oxidase mical2b n=1 Tax=Semicossyphus pulcher TaxID=241346 RepID=UPI0037E9ADDA